MHTLTCHPSLGKWIRTDLGVRTTREQVVRRITRDLHTSEEEEESPQETVVHSATLLPCAEEGDELLPCKEPQLYLCDDWINQWQ